MILITTFTGTIGSELARLVLATGRDVRLAAHTLEKVKTLFPQTEAVAFDFLNADLVNSALSNIDQVFLAPPSDHFPAEYIHRFIDQALAAKVRHIVLLSALGVDLNESELVTEQYLKTSGMAWTILRPSTFMQNYATTMADGIRYQQALFEPVDNARVIFIDTRDIAASACRVLLNPEPHTGQTYTLTGN